MCEIRRHFSVFIDVDVVVLQRLTAQLDVGIAPYIPQLFDRLHSRLGGALGLVSSRDVATLDTLFTPHSFPAAGLYGCELRAQDAVLDTTPFSVDAIDALHEQCLRFASDTTDIVVERGRCSVAVRYLAAAVEMRVWTSYIKC